jgi:NTE family protein
MTKESAALVLSGAVAKGAFEAGVVSALAQKDFVADRFVGTSAGALNATLLAAGAAVGAFTKAAARVEELWRERATLLSFVRPLPNLGLGASSTKAVEQLLVDEIEALVASRTASDLRPTTLTLVTTDLAGSLHEGELTYEDERVFKEADFLDSNTRKEIAKVAAASAAFPVLFIPPILNCRQHVDGGVVNNTPLSYAIDESAGRNSIVVVSAEPNVPADDVTLHLLPRPTLLVRLVEILINERVGRDLVVARKRNEKRKQLIHALQGTGIDAEKVADGLGFRELDILTIRPTKALAGGAFNGFVSKRLRESYIRLGKEAALATLAQRAPPFQPCINNRQAVATSSNP